jgi:hypothetical protein
MNTHIWLNAIGIIFLSLVFVTCSNQRTSKKSADSLQLQDSVSIPTAALPDNISTNAIWVYDDQADSIVQLREVNKDTLTVEKLITRINADYNNEVVISFSRIAHDTLFIAIKDPEYLTQKMGSAGAFEFMISTTFTLTEMRGIEYVSFDFEEGDHASPGNYSRKYFWDWIRENRKLNKK